MEGLANGMTGQNVLYPVVEENKQDLEDATTQLRNLEVLIALVT